jgi:hypothetical protein
MIILKEVKHDTQSNSVEAAWVDEDGEQIKCHSYADVQMNMFRADLGADAASYETLIALVESNIQPPPLPTLQERLSQLEAALDEHLNAAARAKRYNDRFTFAIRAGYVGPYQAEAQIFASWMDACNSAAYVAMGEVIAGTRPVPPVSELISSLPELAL